MADIIMFPSPRPAVDLRLVPPLARKGLPRLGLGLAALAVAVSALGGWAAHPSAPTYYRASSPPTIVYTPVTPALPVKALPPGLPSCPSGGCSATVPF